jgi:alginate O-acetyltransferase complex protein AlgI
MFGAGVPLVNTRSLFELIGKLILLVILTLGSTRLPAKWGGLLLAKGQNHPVLTATCANVVLAAVFAASVAYLVSSSYNPFLYFRF